MEASDAPLLRGIGGRCVSGDGGPSMMGIAALLYQRGEQSFGRRWRGPREYACLGKRRVSTTGRGNGLSGGFLGRLQACSASIKPPYLDLLDTVHEMQQVRSEMI